MTDTAEGEESEGVDGQILMEESSLHQVHLGSPAAGEYSFRLFPVGESQERAPFPLPAPFVDKRLPGDRRSFAGGQQLVLQNTGEKCGEKSRDKSGELSGQKSGEKSGELSGQKCGHLTNENAAPALPPKKGKLML